MNEELKQQISDSPLQPDEKILMKKVFQSFESDLQKSLTEVIREMPDLLPTLYVNLAGKSYALQNGDREDIREIIETETQLLEMLEGTT